MHSPHISKSYALHGSQASHQIEQAAASALPPHSLMQRAGLASAKLTLALAPHARQIWIACGPGNNGGDGFEAALHLHQWGKNVAVSWTGPAPKRSLPADAQASYDKAIAAGVQISHAPPQSFDFCVDALLGLGGRIDSSSSLSILMREWLLRMRAGTAPLLSLDLPSGLNGDNGVMNPFFKTKQPTKNQNNIFCLSLLTLKPGLYTGDGRDAAGQIWFDDLDCLNSNPCDSPSAWLLGADRATTSRDNTVHAQHKGSFGDVAIVGGESNDKSHMSGAALLAARAALHGGAGRVYVALLANSTQGIQLDPLQPELMFRSPAKLDIAQQTVVCGCGGGQAVKAHLPRLLSHAARLILDADALNAIATDTALQTLLKERALNTTVLTPHPLEAARLIGCSTAEIQADRLKSAQTLADRFSCVVVLKGSGSVIAAPGQTPHINASGNARLATAGTGDVLAGLVGARLANGLPAFEAACSAVFAHGLAADQWSGNSALTASGLFKVLT
ncbi:Bifunctional NAD(P)H-hydrate repair enzyme Nnr [Polaromonas vacuolata]|uniref:ADP-dependent (S)-NAD(P)H-hydrate dehydratase n=1 Tax=Polaromonas vacuolata TaxID=37448 RepID=A0A6H2HAZ5_9BURK|nr:NAD(P)H-hydrate dehydratase [Polaromonas vacuolata]QJC57035.1 Bifunctional NAD(P)H-hydrate repair enzyme Nnr [Polaromonas vacuolata]